ncbi:MAG: hypothetical protein N3A01_06025 [Bacteroidales bacterium]|nr:hypothetical protein [Bacteroidales bacterium]
MKEVLVVLLLVVLCGLCACKKHKENLLPGEWQRISFRYDEKDLKWIYKFNKDGTIIEYKADTVCDTAFYKMKTRFFKEYIQISGLRWESGDYYIEKINKKKLILQCYSPYNRMEFIRK